MKKLLCAAFCILLLLVICIPSFAQEGIQITVMPDKTTAHRGDEVTFTVQVSGDKAFTSLGFIPYYDTDVYQLISGEVLTSDHALADFDLTSGGGVVMFNSAAAHSGDFFRFTVLVKEDAPLGAFSTASRVSVMNNTAAVMHSLEQDTVTVACAHDWSAATCTTPKTCSKCKATEGNALGHNYSSVVTKPTCTEGGYTTYNCPACGDTYVDNRVIANGHSWSDATCTTPKTCSVCKATEGKELGHSYDAVVTKPTCTEGGYTTYTCSTCSDTYVDDRVDATGHSWVDATCTAPKTCSVCQITEGGVLDHTWDEGTVTKQATWYNTGTMKYSCTCGKTKSETIPALFYGTTVNLGNTLDLTFFFYDIFADTSGKVVFVRDYADGSSQTTEISLSEVKKNGSFYEIVYPGMAAKEMSDNVHVTIYDANNNAVSETKTDSIRSYALRTLRNEAHANDAKLRTMLVDMLNYGAAAQGAFTYGEHDLANNLLTDAEKSLATQTVQSYSNNRTVSGNASAYYGSTCILESNISFVMFTYSSKIGENGYAKVSYTDYLGQKKSLRVDYVGQPGFQQFTLNEIVVADSRCMLTWDFYNANNELIVSVQDSLESYVARGVNSNPWLEKVLIFTDSARLYLQNKNQQ